MQQTTHAESRDGSTVSLLYQRHAPALLTHLLINSRSREDAEDLLVDTFVAAQEREALLSTLTDEEQRKWLWRVSRNLLIDLHRRSQTRKGISLQEVSELLFDDAHIPEEVMLQQDEYRQLHAMLQRLSAQQQELLRLRFVNGLQHKEIAELMGKGHGAVRVLLSRTLNVLRTIYTKEEASYEKKH